MLLHVCLVIMFSMYVLCQNVFCVCHVTLLSICILLRCLCAATVVSRHVMPGHGMDMRHCLLSVAWRRVAEAVSPTPAHSVLAARPVLLWRREPPFLSVSLSTELPTNVLEPSSSHRDSKCANDCRLY